MQTNNNMNSDLGHHSALCFCLAADKVHNYLDNFLLAIIMNREREGGGGGERDKGICHTDLCILRMVNAWGLSSCVAGFFSA